MRHFNKFWRSTHEKVTYVDDDLVLLDPGCGFGGRLFLANPLEQGRVFRHDVVVPDFAFADDEVHGT